MNLKDAINQIGAAQAVLDSTTAKIPVAAVVVG